MNTPNNLESLLTHLDDLKLSEIITYENNFSDESDYIIITTARSTTHLNSSTENIKLDAKQLGMSVIGTEGVGTNWAVVDLAYVVIHIMLSDARAYYELDKLFSASSE